MNYYIGQSVTLTDAASNSHVLTVGKTYMVVEADEHDTICPIRVINDNGGLWWLHVSQFRVEGNAGELAELRAFKATALARFPALAEPETDEDAATRLSDTYYANEDMSVVDAILLGIRWARENPR